MSIAMERIGWFALAVLGAAALAVVALTRGETINAVWLVIAAVCTYLIAYRFYSLYIAQRVLGLDPTRATPAVRHNDGLDYVPTDKYVLFGHHFAAIAGAGPLVGPVLAAQMGYLPGTLWILVGVVFAGAVQDFVVLFASTRRDGRSLGDMIRSEMGPVAGIIALIGVLSNVLVDLGFQRGQQHAPGAPSRTSASRSSLSSSRSGCSEGTMLSIAAYLSLDGPSAVSGRQQPGGYAALLTPTPIHNFWV
jgi:carbon starvation protein